MESIVIVDNIHTKFSDSEHDWLKVKNLCVEASKKYPNNVCTVRTSTKNDGTLFLDIYKNRSSINPTFPCALNTVRCFGGFLKNGQIVKLTKGQERKINKQQWARY